VVTAKVNFTSGATYSAANWNLSPSYVTPATVDAKVTAAVAASPTVADAAASAVGGALSTAGVVSGGSQVVSEGFGIVITDANGNRSFLETEAAGKPTAYSLKLISEGLGAFNPKTLDGLKQRLRSSGILAAGDSMTVGQEGAGATWPNVLSAETGVPTMNFGEGGRGSADIAIKTGGLAPKLTVTANTIPASGTVAVTAISPTDGYRVSSSFVITRVGRLCGVDGTLDHDLVSGNWSFTRTASGTDVPCPAGSPFYCTEGEAYRTWDLIMQVGRNNVTQATAVVRDVTSMVNHQTPFGRYLAVGVCPAGDSSGDLASVNTVNAALLAALGAEHFYDLRAWMSSTAALAAASITPTGADTTAIAGGYIPPSFRAPDGTHFNAAGYTAAGKGLVAKLSQIGWL
jgi:lysophospholipase L1-like esterase